MTPLIVIPAAGASTRMKGRDKLLEPVNGKPLLRRQAEAAVATGCPVMVALPPGGGARRDALDGLTLTQIEVSDAAEGMGATLRTAALFIARHAFDRPMMILLPDRPRNYGFRHQDRYLPVRGRRRRHTHARHGRRRPARHTADRAAAPDPGVHETHR